MAYLLGKDFLVLAQILFRKQPDLLIRTKITSIRNAVKGTVSRKVCEIIT
jgi:hypothetical protein